MAKILTIYKNGKQLEIDINNIDETLEKENKRNKTNVSLMEVLEAMELMGLAKRV